jgi:SAM-dependent methyltransferase
LRALLHETTFDDAYVLEISPYHSPLCKGASVKYYDVFNRDELVKYATVDNEKRAKTNDIPLNIDRIPIIHYTDATGDMASACPHDHFNLIISSHVIEHQPDLVRHLLDVHTLLKTDSYYLFFIPDKRYCFDHFIPKKSIADVLQAHIEKRKVHTLTSLLQSKLLLSHNSPVDHWNGKSTIIAPPFSRQDLDGLVQLVERGQYIDSHAWQFEDTDFVPIFEQLKNLEFIPQTLSIKKIWKTEVNSHEFAVLLHKA